MSDGTGISWTDATWNVVIGCDKVSAGCDHCYAIRTATRMQCNPNPKIQEPYAGVASGGEWTGRINLIHDRLDMPRRWRKPRRIFVNAQSDLFHRSVPDAFLADVWDVMAATPQHTYQILTKRPARMRSWVSSNVTPLPNVWLGVSAEDQRTADIRVPLLLDTPAAVRWVSAEPLLGPLDLSGWLPRVMSRLRAVHWVVAGGESGPGARPMHSAWPRSLRDQCMGADVPFHFKQWGEYAPNGLRVGRSAAGRVLDGRTWDEYPGGAR